MTFIEETLELLRRRRQSVADLVRVHGLEVDHLVEFYDQLIVRVQRYGIYLEADEAFRQDEIIAISQLWSLSGKVFDAAGWLDDPELKKPHCLALNIAAGLYHALPRGEVALALYAGKKPSQKKVTAEPQAEEAPQVVEDGNVVHISGLKAVKMAG